MNKKEIKEVIDRGEAVLGFEFGSTRIKAVLIGPDFAPIASGSRGWENKFEEGVWTYSVKEIWEGAAACFADLAADVQKEYEVTLRKVKSAGFSAMMHGYIALDATGELLVPFRTWRNNITGEASEKLSRIFGFPIPQRWSIAHLYQAILNNEAHLSNIVRLTTLSGYVHWKLTGEFVLGLDDASGMFPIDPVRKNWDKKMTDSFCNLITEYDFPWKLNNILPSVLPAGETAGTLSKEGALLLDPGGDLEPGIPLCPPEGDAGTGMIATNSIAPRTGNVSAGTSVFAMVVLDKNLSRVHPEIDIVVTPDGNPVGMVHSNNCTSDIDAWISLLVDAANAMGCDRNKDDAFAALLPLALEGDPDGGGLLSYGYIAGEHITGFSEGRPLFARTPESSFTLPNFIRTHMFSSLGALRTGLDILTAEEGVALDEITGHGGFFKTAGVGKKIMAAALNTPVKVLETAGEGGAWGIALLATFMVRKEKELNLSGFLNRVFSSALGETSTPEPKDVQGFYRFFRRYTAGLAIERTAVEQLKKTEGFREE